MGCCHFGQQFVFIPTHSGPDNQHGFSFTHKSGLCQNLSVPLVADQICMNIDCKREPLSLLDIYVLMKILDKNWYLISTKCNSSREDRHYIKEMRSIRNRWMHSSGAGFSTDDIYRDLDTLQRFAGVIQADAGLIQEIQAAKKALLAPEISSSAPDESVSPPPSQEKPEAPITEFAPGQIVSLKSNAEIKGAVVAVLPGQPENRYQVFINGEIQIYYASQLQAKDGSGQKPRMLSRDQFHAYLSALQIRYPGLSALYSLNAARIDFVPYQFRPVLKFIRSDRPRLLIADSVGVGKTIEAGLILRELQARRDIRSVLIICPRPLVAENKWHNEMKRFEERFEHLDGPNLQYCIKEMHLDGEWPERYRKAIIPYSLFDESLLDGKIPSGKQDTRRVKRKKGLLDLDPPPKFDLVIVDEAHHIRNTDTARHKVVRFFCEHAEAVVFLTATPIQLGDNDLFVLLNTLRPDLIIDRESYAHMAAPNPSINRAVALARSRETGWEAEAVSAMDEAAATPWGKSILQNSPDFNRIRTRLTEGEILPDERVQLVTDMESLHTFAGIINRTRRRDIGDFTIRKPETVTVPFTPDQQALHDAILGIQAEIFSTLHGNVFVKFMMTTIRRQAASCLFGLVPFLEDILGRHVDELEWTEADSDSFAPGEETMASISSRIQTIIEIARRLDPVDPKLEALRQIIRDKQNLPNNKIMVFSSFRHTLGYLYKRLMAEGFRVGMVHGNTPDEDRAEFRERFAAARDQADALDVLLFSEIGCEGLDYQFCDCIVNYDLPWNPMRVEQRIGRIDRKGQKSEAVAIYNLITPGTVDADIYERCLLRIGVFEHALGGSEEILGEITTGIKNIAENLTLTEEERRAKLDQLSDNKIREIQEQERLEEKEMELFGIRLSQDQINQDIEDASSFWLSSGSLLRLVDLYLRQIIGKDQEFILGEKPLKTLRLSEEARGLLLQDYQKLPRKISPAYRQWENWLKGGDPHLSITFESECAAAHPDSAFIMPVHPLVRQAAFSLEPEKQAVTMLKVKDSDAPAGRHLFVMYQWQFHGIREDSILRPIAMNDVLTEKLPELLKHAEPSALSETDIPDLSAWDDIDTRHYNLWTEAREKHRLRTCKMAEYQRESLIKSHNAIMAQLNEQLSKATNEKIQKMKRGQLANAETDYSRHIQGLDIAKERADITAGPVGYGVILIESEIKI
jgi:superfamily II DNA or RNA helicase